jgi:hypothetical protein
VEVAGNKARNVDKEIPKDPADVGDERPPHDRALIILYVKVEPPEKEADDDERETLGSGLAKSAWVLILALQEGPPPVPHLLAVVGLVMSQDARGEFPRGDKASDDGWLALDDRQGGGGAGGDVLKDREHAQNVEERHAGGGYCLPDGEGDGCKGGGLDGGKRDARFGNKVRVGDFTRRLDEFGQGLGTRGYPCGVLGGSRTTTRDDRDS